MKTISKEKQNAIVTLNQTLENAKVKLKEEFVGIDQVIDQIADMCRAWYVFPEYQLKPTVINLWGMTGVGKTSLVKRFCELINFSNKLISFDLGSSVSESWTFQNNIKSIAEVHQGKPVVILLDEFQHARTLNRIGEELDRPAARMVWEVLDSGQFTTVDYPYGLADLNELICKLREILALGVVVENGLIKDSIGVYYKIFYKGLVNPDAKEKKNVIESFKKAEDEFDLFVPARSYDVIIGLLPDLYPTRLSLWEDLQKLNGNETVRFLKHLYEQAIAPKKIDCTKSLIFVLGNLDEAYNMSKDISVDMEADNFHENSLEIKLPDIKQALLLRFRAEQLSRLGNNHIIYPAFNNENYRELISRYLQRIADRTFSSLGINLKFENTVHELLYKEGVVPTQGTRPLFSTINNLIETKLPKIITSVFIQKRKCDSLVLSYEGDKLISTSYFKKKRTATFEEIIELALGQLRITKRNDKQALVAVHEAGHAVVYIVLSRRLPERIVSVAIDASCNGFVSIKDRKGFRSRKDMENEICTLLGGYAAEILIFGKDFLTSGASFDFSQATSRASDMVRELGMGSLIGSYRVRSAQTNAFLHNEDQTTREMERILADALAVTNQVLEENRPLLLALADYLSDERMMEKKMIAEYVSQYSTLQVENDERIFETIHYRKRLKEQVNESRTVTLKTA